MSFRSESRRTVLIIKAARLDKHRQFDYCGFSSNISGIPIHHILRPGDSVRIVSGLTLVACLMLSSCLSSVRIKTADSTAKPIGADVPGIPFYVKTAKCKQEMTWMNLFTRWP